MEAVVLVTVLASSVVLAVGAAFASLALAMYLIDVATGWTMAADRRRLARASAWTDVTTAPERAAVSKQPVAA